MYLTKDSRQCNEDSIYFCFLGENVDGHDYIEDARKRGCKHFVGTKDIKMDGYTKVDDIDIAFSEYSKREYNYKDVSMKFIGITGTDGKTSVALIVNQLLNKLSTSSYLGTSGLIIGENKHGYNGMTTPFANDLYKYISEADKNSENFVMEVSSHALAQKRVAGLNFDIALFNNFSNDHLDFHKTLEHYFDSKLKIVDYLKPDGIMIVNSELKEIEKIRDKRDIITFGEKGDYKISDIKLSLSETKFTLTFKEKNYEIQSPLLAKFNVYNLTAAIAIVNQLGYEITEILKHINDLEVEGRMMYLKSNNSCDFILDFAHTADAIDKIMSFINDYKEDRKLFVVTGSAGGRDHLKRPLMGKAASDYADVIIFTEDDPRFEDVKEISKDLLSGVENKKCEVHLIDKRKEAIEFALKKSSKNDIIILLGKSGQTKMYIDDYTVDYDEIQYIKQIIMEDYE